MWWEERGIHLQCDMSVLACTSDCSVQHLLGFTRNLGLDVSVLFEKMDEIRGQKQGSHQSRRTFGRTVIAGRGD